MAAEVVEERKPAEIMQQLRRTNVKDIVLGMTTHEQLKMIRNIIE